MNPYFAQKAIQMLDTTLVSVGPIFSNIDFTCGGVIYSGQICKFYPMGVIWAKMGSKFSF